MVFTYEKLKGYSNQILINMLENEKKALIEYHNKEEFEHERMTQKVIDKIKKILKGRGVEYE